MNLYHGDCLEILPTFPPASVDAIITDLPYGTTACEWDSIIPLDEMWQQVKRVLKVNGVFITTASQPFTTVLIQSNFDWFKYEWIWKKEHAANFLNVKSRPLSKHESILIFGKSSNTYNPQTTKGKRILKHKGTAIDTDRQYSSIHGSVPPTPKSVYDDNYYPISVLEFSAGARIHMKHPTQKPVALYEYLIRTYTNPGETVLDFCFGSCTTGVAAKQTGRNFIGIEKERKYFEIGKKRYEQAQEPLFVESPRQPTTLAPDAGKAAAQKGLFE